MQGTYQHRAATGLVCGRRLATAQELLTGLWVAVVAPACKPITLAYHFVEISLTSLFSRRT